MTKNKITEADVLANMQDVLVRTVEEFGKPTTYVTVRMQNGFTVRQSTTCVDPRNYNEEIGTQICLDKIKDEVYKLLGYELQSKIANREKVVNPSLKTLTKGTDILCIEGDGSLSLGVINGRVPSMRFLRTIRPSWTLGVSQVQYDESKCIHNLNEMQKGVIYVVFTDDNKPTFIQKTESVYSYCNAVLLLEEGRKGQCFSWCDSYEIEEGAYPIVSWKA